MALLLACAMCVTALAGCNSSKASPEKVVTINFPTSWVGVHPLAGWFKDRMEAFNEQYKGKYELVTEEIPGDQNYVNKMKVLFASQSLPDVIATGGYNLIDTMKSQFVDLSSYVNEDADWKAHISELGLNVNTRDGKLYGIPYTKQVIGYFYNKTLFQEAGIDKPAQTWDEFFTQLDMLKASGITPLSMDTADSGWVTSLMMCAMVAGNDAGETFMNTVQPTDYNTPEFIAAATNIQKMFENYTTSNAIGGNYDNAASNFFASNTAILANGPWMVGNFYDTAMAPADFVDNVAVAQYPGGVMYNAGEIGFNVAAKTPEEIDAAIAFVKFMTTDESQKVFLETSGGIPDSTTITADSKVKPLVTDTIKLANDSTRRINDFQSLWYANVVDEISVQYPLLAQGTITPTQFASALTAAAQKNSN